MVSNLLHISNITEFFSAILLLYFWEICRLLHNTYSPSLFLIMLTISVKKSDEEQPYNVNFM